MTVTGKQVVLVEAGTIGRGQTGRQALSWQACAQPSNSALLCMPSGYDRVSLLALWFTLQDTSNRECDSHNRVALQAFGRRITR